MGPKMGPSWGALFVKPVLMVAQERLVSEPHYFLNPPQTTFWGSGGRLKTCSFCDLSYVTFPQGFYPPPIWGHLGPYGGHFGCPFGGIFCCLFVFLLTKESGMFRRGLVNKNTFFLFTRASQTKMHHSRPPASNPSETKTSYFCPPGLVNKNSPFSSTSFKP